MADMEIVQVDALSKILVHTVFGFRRRANVAIQCIRDWVNADEKDKDLTYGLAVAAQTELSFLYPPRVVKPAVLTRWLMGAKLFA